MTAPFLPGLFDARAATSEVDLFRDPVGELLPEEASALPRAASERVLEYRAGRHCARVALGALGAPLAPVLRREDRAPIWPAGFVGSISHTRRRGVGFCGAVVGRASEFRAIGLDLELDEPLERDLFKRILTSREARAFERLSEGEQGRRGKLVFSAKEAFYKCQFPISGQFLEFSDVEVSLFEAEHEFEVVLLRGAGPFVAGTAFRGRYAMQTGVIATGVCLARVP